MDPIAVKHLKNYQVWHHRRLILTKLGKPAAFNELKFIARSLNADEKNYHTWSYRQWLLSHFNDDDLWENELDFTDHMIVDDVRNNSAWHHRFFVVWQSGVRDAEADRERVTRRELTYVHSCIYLSFIPDADPSHSYVKQNISLAPNNSSAWNYLRGMLEHNKIPFSSVRQFVEPYTKPGDPAAVDVVDLVNPPPSQQAQLPCPAAIEFMADIYEAEGQTSISNAIEVSAIFHFFNQHLIIHQVMAVTGRRT